MIQNDLNTSHDTFDFDDNAFDDDQLFIDNDEE